MTFPSPFEDPGDPDHEDEALEEGGQVDGGVDGEEDGSESVDVGRGDLAAGALDVGDLGVDALEDVVLTDPDLEDAAMGDEDLGEGEDGEDGESGEPADPDAADVAPAKSKKVHVDDEPVAHPDTPVPTKVKMLAALEWAFEAEADAPPELLDKYADHALLLLKRNCVMNLTTVLDPKELAAKVYLDSWRVSRLVPLMATRLLDLGSGGGFPGLLIAMAEPMCSVVLSEDSEKKSGFLRECVEALALRNVTVVHERAEDFLTRERVDTVVVRAVSSVRENVRTLRKVRHAVKDVVMLKTQSWSREVRAAEREVERLGFKLDTVWEHELPGEMGQRAILVYRAPGGAGM
jgi:16S rRNA (guanine527-N7)-methyltransferase